MDVCDWASRTQELNDKPAYRSVLPIIRDENRVEMKEHSTHCDVKGDLIVSSTQITRNSTSGAIFLVAGGAISWRSKKQNFVANSTCEAEYTASCLATKQSMWIARLLGDLEKSEPPQVPVKIDNSGTIETGKNTSINQRNKHIDLQYHFVRDSVQAKRIELVPFETSNQVADPLTKPLDRVCYEKRRNMSGITSNPLS